MRERKSTATVPYGSGRQVNTHEPNELGIQETPKLREG